MDAQILTVHWHEGEQPVYSAHFQPNSDHTTNKTSQRLATGGGDNNVRLWRLVGSSLDSDSNTPTKVEYLSTLAKHTQAVNVVRFDPQGTLLATAGDDGCAMIWTKSDAVVREFGAEPDDDASESWTMRTLCRSSASEIYDLAWSPDSKHIITGSTDNVARVYDVSTGQQVTQITEHSHYVQGVAWDPRGKFLATQSADRSVQVQLLKGGEKEFKTSVLQKSSRTELPTRQANEIITDNDDTPTKSTTQESLPPLNYAVAKSSMLYHTESLRSFFRRLTFSPDGNFLLTPAGIFKNSPEQDKDELLNTVYIYTRRGINKPPIAHLPGFKKPALVVAFSPVFYELDSDTSSSKVGVFQLPYKMIYAVATVDAVHIFDTQSEEALGSVSSIHYGTLTDITWNNDGKSLLVSSADGFCTVLKFSPGTLGNPKTVDLKTNLSDDVGEDLTVGATPKSSKKRAMIMQPSSVNKSFSTTTHTTSPITIPSSPITGPLDLFVKANATLPLVSPLQKPAPVMNSINHLVRKKEKKVDESTIVQRQVPLPAVQEQDQEHVDVVMIDDAPEEKPDVIMINDEPPTNNTPAKEKKRISPTLVTGSTTQ